MQTKRMLRAAALGASVLLTACGYGPKSVLNKTIEAEFNHPLCLAELQQFPYVSAREPQAWLQSLVGAGLLEVQDSGGEYHYTMTEKAQDYSQDGRHFCYGKQFYVRLNGLKEPKSGFQPGQEVPIEVVVERKVTESWASADALKSRIESGQTAFPAVLAFAQDGSVSLLRQAR